MKRSILPSLLPLKPKNSLGPSRYSIFIKYGGCPLISHSATRIQQGSFGSNSVKSIRKPWCLECNGDGRNISSRSVKPTKPGMYCRHTHGDLFSQKLGQWPHRSTANKCSLHLKASISARIARL